MAWRAYKNSRKSNVHFIQLYKNDSLKPDLIGCSVSSRSGDRSDHVAVRLSCSNYKTLRTLANEMWANCTKFKPFRYQGTWSEQSVRCGRSGIRKFWFSSWQKLGRKPVTNPMQTTSDTADNRWIRFSSNRLHSPCEIDDRNLAKASVAGGRSLPDRETSLGRQHIR